jgi:hypothetical protein
MPIKQRGPAAERWARWQDFNRSAVQRRAAFACEGCGSRNRPLEWAHLAGRNSKGVGEPWASSAELTVGLCTSAYGVTGCHQKIDRALAPQLLKDLRTAALVRLCSAYSLGLAAIVGEHTEPLDAIREAVRGLEADWEYDQDSNQIVQR